MTTSSSSSITKCKHHRLTNAYPTDQAIAQKAAKVARELSLAQSGATKEEIKASRKKLKQVQEDHHDDCGSDTGPIEEESQRTPLGIPSCVGHTLGDAVAHSFFESSPDIIKEF